MRIQRGLKKDSSLAKFILGAHPIIEHFIEMMRIRGIVSTYVPSDKRMKLDDEKVLGLLIHNTSSTSCMNRSLPYSQAWNHPACCQVERSSLAVRPPIRGFGLNAPGIGQLLSQFILIILIVIIIENRDNHHGDRWDQLVVAPRRSIA